ncbi:hypothetical protein AX16_001992 [Volvariella volvacea WC 439]|nr:hypothetical protein AX16_001992 [Volvariella volvacea WC 439]
MKEGLMLCGFSPSFSTFPIDFEEETVPRKLVYLRSLVLASFWVLLTMSSPDSGSTLDPAIAGMIDILKEAWIVKYTNGAPAVLSVIVVLTQPNGVQSRFWSRGFGGNSNNSLATIALTPCESAMAGTKSFIHDQPLHYPPYALLRRIEYVEQHLSAPAKLPINSLPVPSIYDLPQGVYVFAHQSTFPTV